MSKQKELGQFFTPLPVVEFIFSALQRLSGELRHPKVIDPACGEGVFLKYALDAGITPPGRLYGLDKDEAIAQRWVEQGIYNKGMHLFIHDGLYEDERTPGVVAGSFDWVVGNPPFGGLGLRGLRQLAEAIEREGAPPGVRRRVVREQVPLFSQEASVTTPPSAEAPRQTSSRDLDLAHLRDVSRALVHNFALWRNGKTKGYDIRRASHRFAIRGVEFDAADLPYPQDIPRLERFPIEVLFFERFINLAKPGGFIAIIVPDGVLANSTMQYVRDWALRLCHLVCVVSLPRDTFKGTGTSAKASVVMLKKLNEGEDWDGKREVLMATATELTQLKEVAEMLGNPSVNPLKTEVPGLTAFVADNRISSSPRWDPRFWDPAHFEYRNYRAYPIRRLGEFVTSITYGPIVTGASPRQAAVQRGGVVVVGQKQLDDVGLDLTGATRVRARSPWDAPRARVTVGDLLLPRSGVGSLGRGRVAVFGSTEEGIKAAVSCFVDLVRLDGVEPEYVAIYMKTRFGRMQVDRLMSGVGTINLDFDDVRGLEIHLPPPKMQRRVVEGYKDILRKYPAPRARRLPAALAELGELIRSLEQVIEGKARTI